MGWNIAKFREREIERERVCLEDSWGKEHDHWSQNGDQ
jgi:hypothetical protein